MWFCFMQHERLDNKQLLFENVPMKFVKLHQVFDVIFKVHANELGQLSLQIKSLGAEFTGLSGEITTLTGFLNERKVPSRDKLEEKLLSLSKFESELLNRLRAVTETLRGESDVAQQLRKQLSKNDRKIAE